MTESVFMRSLGYRFAGIYYLADGIFEDEIAHLTRQHCEQWALQLWM